MGVKTGDGGRRERRKEEMCESMYGWSDDRDMACGRAGDGARQTTRRGRLDRMAVVVTGVGTEVSRYV